MNKRLYTLTVSEEAQQVENRTQQRGVQALGPVTGTEPAAETVSLEPGERQLQGQLRGQYADEMAAELEELFGGGIEAAPFYAVGGAGDEDGYYELGTIRTKPVDPRSTAAYEFDGRITAAGTRRSHWRSVSTRATQRTTDFGSGTNEVLAVPAAATKVRWAKPESAGREAASTTGTVTAEFGDLDTYEASASTYVDPVLIYDLAYAEEGKTDVRVWDDHGNASRTDANGDTQWQKVFAANHEYDGDPIVANGRIRLTFDEATPAITAEAYSAGSWGTVSLGSSTWELFDLDLTLITPVDVRGQVEFTDTSDGSMYSLDMTLQRGREFPSWFIPENLSGPTPTGLQDLLNPIAEGETIDLKPSQGLVGREEVRQ